MTGNNPKTHCTIIVVKSNTPCRRGFSGVDTMTLSEPTIFGTRFPPNQKVEALETPKIPRTDCWWSATPRWVCQVHLDMHLHFFHSRPCKRGSQGSRRGQSTLGLHHTVSRNLHSGLFLSLYLNKTCFCSHLDWFLNSTLLKSRDWRCQAECG